MENRYKVLIADDDAHISELIALYMEKEGYETLEAHTGREAIESFKEHDPDIVLLDIMMPDTDGYQVCREIRHLSHRKAAGGAAEPVSDRSACCLGTPKFERRILHCLKKPFP